MRRILPVPRLLLRPGKRAGLALLIGLGGGLGTVILFDIYQDWLFEGDPLWTTLAENAVFFALALFLSLGAWRVAWTGKERQLGEMARGALVGAGAAVGLAGLGLGLQVVQGEIKPAILMAQVAVAGAFVGLLVGFSRAQSSLGQGGRSRSYSLTGPAFGPEGTEDGEDPWGPLGLMATIGLGLAGAVAFDIYHDWSVQGNQLWSTFLENLLPLGLALTIPLAGWRLLQTDQGRAHLRQVSVWTLIGTLGTLALTAIVSGLQLYQGQWKPGIMITQLTAAGAVAGLLIGRKQAQVYRTNQVLRRRESRLRALIDSVPGGVFCVEIQPDGTRETTFMSPAARRLLGVSDADQEGVYDRLLEGIPDAYQDEARASLKKATDQGEEMELEIPFHKPSGEQLWLQIRSAPEHREDRLVFQGIISDITQRKEAERRRKMYERLKENAKEAIVIANEAGEIIDWNPGAASTFGHEREEILGRPVEAIMPGRHREPHRRGMQQVRETGHGDLIGETIELNGLHRAGHEIPLELSLFTWQDEREQYFAAIIRDITERREAEQARLEEQARFETLFENVPSPAVHSVAREEGLVVVDVNKSFEDTFGITAAQVEGQVIDDLIMPEARREEAQALNRRVLEEGEVQAEVRREASGEIRDFQLRAARQDPKNGPPEVHALYTDITEQKRRERRLEAIFNHTFQFTGLMEPDGTMIEANDTALKFGDLEREDIVGTPIWETYWAQTGRESKRKLREAVQRASEGEFVRYERTIRGAEENRIIDLSIRPVTDEDGEVSMLIPEARDITKLKEREQKLRRAKREAEESSRLKTAMLANMSHEIRTPLTPINGFAESLAETLSGEEARLARRIRKSAKRLQETIDSVLQISQLEAGTQDLKQEAVDLRRAASEGVKALEGRGEEKGVEVLSKFPDQPVEVEGDRVAIRRITENLLENAVKFTPEGGQATVRVRTSDRWGVLEVEDTGIGISEEALSDIFEAFRQESEGIDREFEGTGLGLTIVQRLTDALGGRVDVESEKGEGSRFTVRLPIGQA